MMRRALLVPLVVLLSGCAGAPSDPQRVADADVLGDDAVFLTIIVVDAEILPVPGASVTLEPTGMNGTTDAAGQVRLGPLDVGAYEVTVERLGYATARAEASMGQADQDLIVTLRPTATNVPYHSTEVHQLLIFCRWAIDAIGSSIPCNPVPEEATGVNVTGYQCCFEFDIPEPNLANMLHEMEWRAQSTAAEMGIELSGTELTQAQSQTYLLRSGAAPLQSWLTPGVIGIGGDVEFVGDAGTTYIGSHPIGPNNSTLPGVALAIEQRVNNWVTFFYNRPGPETFSALPDQ